MRWAALLLLRGDGLDGGVAGVVVAVHVCLRVTACLSGPHCETGGVCARLWPPARTLPPSPRHEADALS